MPTAFWSSGTSISESRSAAWWVTATSSACAVLLPDGHRALAGSQYGNLILWDIDSQRDVHRFSPTAASGRAGQLGLAVLADEVHARRPHRRGRAILEAAHRRWIDQTRRPVNGFTGGDSSVKECSVRSWVTGPPAAASSCYGTNSRTLLPRPCRFDEWVLQQPA